MVDKTIHATICDLNFLVEIAEALSAQGKTLFIASDGEAKILPFRLPSRLPLDEGSNPCPLPTTWDPNFPVPPNIFTFSAKETKP